MRQLMRISGDSIQELEWKQVEGVVEEAMLGDFKGGDGVRFSLSRHPTCYRRGPWRLLIEVAPGHKHILWGCFDGEDQPQRWYHKRENALSEAQAIENVLLADRHRRGRAGPVRVRRRKSITVH